MSAAALTFRSAGFTWAGWADDDARFSRIRTRVMLGCVAVCIALPWLPVHEAERVAPVEAPLPVVKMLLEPPAPVAAKPVPPPPKVQPDAAPQTRPLPGTDPVVAKAAEPKPKPDPSKAAPVTEARNPVPGKPPGEELDAARRKASGVGLLAMKDALAELHSAPAAVQLKADIKPGAGVGTGAGVGVGAGSEAGLPVRSMITSNATGGSGGINTAGFSRDTGGGGLAGRATTMVTGVAGGGGGGGPGVGGGGHGNGFGTGGNGGGGNGKGGTLTKSGSGKASRSIEEIKLVFERNKGAIYALYNRALRDEPALQGKVVLELKIAPTGEVVDCRIVSTELKAEELEKKLLARIRQFDFGAKDVEQMVVSWPVDFLPS